MTVIIVPALRRLRDHNGVEHEASNFPERISTEELLGLRHQQGTFIFSNQYMLNPVNTEGNFLRREWLHGYKDPGTLIQWPSPDLPPFQAIYAGVDPASSDDTTSDYVTIAIGGVNNNQLYPFRLIRDHMSIFRLKLVLKELHTLYGFYRIGFETNAAQKFMAQYLAENTWLPIQEIPSKGQKEVRFGYMSGPFEAGRVLLPMTNQGDADRNWCEGNEFAPFFEEWVGFPLAAHDDTLDAMEKLCAVSMTVAAPASTSSEAIYAAELERLNDPERKSHVFETGRLPSPMTALSMRSRMGGLTRRERMAMGLIDRSNRGRLINRG